MANHDHSHEHEHGQSYGHSHEHSHEPEQHPSEAFAHPLGIWLGVFILWALGTGMVWILFKLLRREPAE